MNKELSAPTDTMLNSLSKFSQNLHGKRIWLACSGGRDSLSLTHICHKLFDAGVLPFLPQLIHVNHGIQAGNDEWAKYVKSWARDHSMSCTILNLQLNEKSEQAARQARYDAMFRVMNDGDVLMLAHHRDDQVETVLMRLFNGTGINGLRGMRQWSSKLWSDTSDFQDMDERAQIHAQSSSGSDLGNLSNRHKVVYLWRPWLTLSRAQITDYAHHVGLDYIDDPTNIIQSDHHHDHSVPIFDTNVINTKVTNTKVTNTKVDSKKDVRNKVNDNFNESAKNNASNNASTHVSNNISNHLNNNDRAWMRSVLMPMIKSRYPNADQAIARCSQLMEDANSIITERVQMDLTDVLDNQLISKLTNSYHPSKPTVDSDAIRFVNAVIDIDKLLQIPHARQSALIHHWLSPTDRELAPSKRMVEDVLALCKRNDNNHQTCLYWQNQTNSYEIRRYKSKLYRLHSRWVDWLETPPSQQVIADPWARVVPNNSKRSESTRSQSNNCILKSDATLFKWRLLQIDDLFKSLKAKLLADGINSIHTISQSVNESNETSELYLHIEPLPRNKKLTLAHRQGSKSRKKLLQALDQPMFLRPSVTLVSFSTSTSTSMSLSYEAESYNTKIPIFLIAIDGIYNLDSPFTAIIDKWINRHEFVLQFDSVLSQ